MLTQCFSSNELKSAIKDLLNCFLLLDDFSLNSRFSCCASSYRHTAWHFFREHVCRPEPCKKEQTQLCRLQVPLKKQMDVCSGQRVPLWKSKLWSLVQLLVPCNLPRVKGSTQLHSGRSRWGIGWSVTNYLSALTAGDPALLSCTRISAPLALSPAHSSLV